MLILAGGGFTAGHAEEFRIYAEHHPAQGGRLLHKAGVPATAAAGGFEGFIANDTFQDLLSRWLTATVTQR